MAGTLAIALVTALFGVPADAASDTLNLARLDGDRATLVELTASGERHAMPLPSTLTTPLGSVWKLYVHAYALDRKLHDPGYQCTGQNVDEVYCCDPGQRIDRDQALVHSCGLYYAPARLGIDASSWRAYWQARKAPAWLLDLAQLQPQTEVPVAELLATLKNLPAQDELRRVLLDVIVQARDPEVIGYLGGALRVKTWSWHRSSPVPVGARLRAIAVPVGARLRAIEGPVSAAVADDSVGDEEADRAQARSHNSDEPNRAQARSHNSDEPNRAQARSHQSDEADRAQARSHGELERIGGFAGWLVDGTPIWALAGGSSQAVLSRYASALGRELTTVAAATANAECVDVALFDRYPIAAVTQGGRDSAAGRLSGAFEVRFANGNQLAIDSGGELVLSHVDGRPTLVAHLGREDYVARVLDREAATEPLAAARALTVVIRSYLQQNASHRGECLAIADSSAQQRVAPRKASAAARAVVASTADLVLSGSAVGYHRDRADADQLSWNDAVDRARGGARFDQILRQAFPRATLSSWYRPGNDCLPLAAATDWLRAQLPGWRERLDAIPGYAETREFDVCKLVTGRPFVDRQRLRIHVRGLGRLQDRLDLTHEYLHLAFSAHPAGQDEAFVEDLARRLLLE